jgi:hypothetical protein
MRQIQIWHNPDVAASVNPVAAESVILAPPSALVSAVIEQIDRQVVFGAVAKVRVCVHETPYGLLGNF